MTFKSSTHSLLKTLFIIVVALSSLTSQIGHAYEYQGSLGSGCDQISQLVDCLDMTCVNATCQVRYPHSFIRLLSTLFHENKNNYYYEQMDRFVQQTMNADKVKTRRTSTASITCVVPRESLTDFCGKTEL